MLFLMHCMANMAKTERFRNFWKLMECHLQAQPRFRALLPLARPLLEKFSPVIALSFLSILYLLIRTIHSDGSRRSSDRFYCLQSSSPYQAGHLLVFLSRRI